MPLLLQDGSKLLLQDGGDLLLQNDSGGEITLTRRASFFQVEWTQGLARRAHIPSVWGGSVTGFTVIPTDWAGLLGTTSKFIPVEWLQAQQLGQRLLPVEILQGISRTPRLPVVWAGLLGNTRKLLPISWAGLLGTRQARLPFENTGLDENLLLHRWNVLQRMDNALLHAWDIVSDVVDGDGFTLQHTWTVLESLESLTHIWNAIPEIITPFSQDVQKPTAEADKTP